jgi:hypothetical protein
MVISKSFLTSADPLTFAKLELNWMPQEWQADVLRSKSRQTILNCFRQSGKSTVAAILALHQALYFPDSLILLVSPSQRQSSEVFCKVLRFKDSLAFEVKLLEDNKQSIMLENGSRIMSLPDSPERIRGFSDPSPVIIDVASMVSDATINALRPMRMRSQKRLLLLSTPFGKQGYFFRVWHRNDPDWKYVKITVDDVDYVDKDWLESEKMKLARYIFAKST